MIDEFFNNNRNNGLIDNTSEFGDLFKLDASVDADVGDSMQKSLDMNSKDYQNYKDAEVEKKLKDDEVHREQETHNAEIAHDTTVNDIAKQPTRNVVEKVMDGNARLADVEFNGTGKVETDAFEHEDDDYEEYMMNKLFNKRRRKI